VTPEEKQRLAEIWHEYGRKLRAALDARNPKPLSAALPPASNETQKEFHRRANNQWHRDRHTKGAAP
jgi:hypothetical protein